MKHFTLLLGFISLLSWQGNSQILNQAASWPNATWTLNGNYNVGTLLSDPTVSANFSYDDDAAGSGSPSDVLQAESPIIDLTAAAAGGETWVNVDYDYDYNLGSIFNLEYYDADLLSWVVWEALPDNSDLTSGWCAAIANPIATSTVLDVSGFSANQLAGFRYRFHYNANGVWGWGMCVSSPTIYSSMPPTCLDPSALTAANITSSGADLGWTDPNGAGLYNIEYGIAGFALGTGTQVLGTPNNPESIVGLTPVTDYQFYIQADCGGGDLSNWVGPFSFSTLCDVYTPNYTQTFTTYLPDECWSEANGGEVIDGPQTPGFSNWTANAEIGNTVSVNLYTTGTRAWALSPFFDLSLGGYEAVLDVAVTDWLGSTPDAMDSDDEVQLLYSEDGIAWNNLITWNASNALANTLTTFNASIPSNASNVQFAIFASDGTSSGFQDYDFHFDNFIIRTPPTCPQVTAVSLDSTASDAFLISWTAGNTESSWNVEYGVAGFTQGTGTSVVVSSPEILIQGLNSYTEYTIYIQADCGGGDESEFVAINGTTNLACGSVFTDTGGDAGDYTNSENLSWEVCASSQDEYVSVNFSEFNTEENYDFLTIYVDGNFYGEYDGLNSPGIVNSSLGGCLTFEFTSDGSVIAPGWIASITCETCSSSTPGIDGQEDFCYLEGAIDLTPVITPGEAGGLWEFPTNSALLTGSTLNISTLPAGSYDAYYLYAAIDGCDFDTTVATVTVFGASNAGENSLVQACINSSVNMFDAFTSPVDLDGTWYDPSNQVTSSTFGTGGMTGFYNYIYIASNGVCPNDTSEVVLQLLDCVASIEESTLSEINVYPNPSNGLIYISGKFNNEDFEYEVTDLNGRLIANATKIVDGAITFEIDLSEKENGIYIVHLKSNESERFVRIVKQ